MRNSMMVSYIVPPHHGAQFARFYFGIKHYPCLFQNPRLNLFVVNP